MFSGATGARLRDDLFHPVWQSSPTHEFGAALAGIGDFDGDGHNDIVIGAPADSGGNGRLDVFSGRTWQVLFTALGQPGSRLGSSFARAGDVDRDGRADFAVGAPLEAVGGQVRGSVTVLGYRVAGAVALSAAACSNPAAPVLSDAGSSPRRGGRLSFACGHPQGATAGVWLWGLSNTMAGGVPLPFDLAAVGIPGCSLRVSPDFPLGFPGGTAARIALDLPSANAVIGQRLHLQAAILGPVLPGGASFSAAASVLIGH